MKNKWIKVVERRGQSVLISSYFYNGIQTKYFQNIKISRGLDHYLIVDFSNYYLQSEVSAFRDAISLKIRRNGATFINKVLDLCEEKANSLLGFSKSVMRSANILVKQKALIQFKEFSKCCLEFGPAMYFPILIEPIIETALRKILSKRMPRDQEKYFALLSASNKPTESTKEFQNILLLAKIYYHNNRPSGKKFQKMIQKHIIRFGWISFTKFVGEPWNKDGIIDRIKKFHQTNIDYELQELKRKYLKVRIETKKILEKYNFKKDERDFVRMAQRLAYFRSWRLDVYTQAGFLIKNLIQYISDELSIKPCELVWFTYQEIIEALEGRDLLKKNIAKRRMRGGWQMLFDHGKITFQYTPPFLIDDTFFKKEIQIQGRSAYKGHVVGKVRIIRGPLEFHKMIDNAVLVTSMTTPDFVTIMQKSSAIVTDEGGITCHAAIVSREMKKPCIIGTKIATKVFKDGDLVEVDADKGIVRKI